MVTCNVMVWEHLIKHSISHRNMFKINFIQYTLLSMSSYLVSNKIL